MSLNSRRQDVTWKKPPLFPITGILIVYYFDCNKKYNQAENMMKIHPIKHSHNSNVKSDTVNKSYNFCGNVNMNLIKAQQKLINHTRLAKCNNKKNIFSRKINFLFFVF